METEIVKTTKKIIGYTAIGLIIGFGAIAQYKGKDFSEGIFLGLFFTIIASFFIILGAIIYQKFCSRSNNSCNDTNYDDEKIALSPRSGTNFRDTKLVQINGSRIEIKPTIQSYIFYLIVIGIAGFIFTIAINQKNPSTLSTTIVTIVLIVIVSQSSMAMYKLVSTKIVFDQNRNVFWIGGNEYNANTKISLQDIDSIQIIIKAMVGSDGPNWESYELNIVEKNGNRHNIMDHAKIGKIMEEGEVLSKFLSVPLKVR
jgi:hypothetical protein